MSNRLASETSPYLLQHAENPVEWYPWGPEALARAAQEDKPILLSIGYAACHWCHVMAHESFEDHVTAAIMNEHFVNIKVDREERPDLDSIYMQAVQAITGRGGWPMTVFLTPDGTPFYGGTYFPPNDQHGIPSFRRILHAVADTYANQRENILQSAESLRTLYRDLDVAPRSPGEVNPAQMALAHQQLRLQYDKVSGGFGSAPKFPPTMALDFLVRHWARTGDDQALSMARDTFLAMARGGIYDQVGGGFARYAVDGEWRIPHFEKMLYDNALLLRLGAHLYQVTHDEEIRQVTEETATWLAHEMTAPAGGFYSSLDADSEGHEGKFYVWSAAELDALLGDDAQIVKTYYGVTESGNFEESNVLYVATDMETAAARAGVTPDAMRSAIAHAKRVLLEARHARIRPGRDEKCIAVWNGLALRGLLEVARTFARDDLAALAMSNAAFLSTAMVREGRVLRTHTAGVSRIPGFLDDHAAVALGFLAMFEHTLERSWLDRAREVATVMLEQFWDEERGIFYDTARDAETLITRPRDVADNAVPSGTALAAELLIRLSDYTGDEEIRKPGQFVLESLMPAASQHPLAFGHLLGVGEYVLTTTCHGDYCDMPSPRAIDIARATFS